MMLRYFMIGLFIVGLGGCGCNNTRSVDKNDVKSLVHAEQKEIITSSESTANENQESILKEKEVIAVVEENKHRSKSQYVESGCDLIITKYSEAIELLRKDNSAAKAKLTIKSLRNDPIVRDCRKDEKYRKKFKKLDKEYYSLK